MVRRQDNKHQYQNERISPERVSVEEPVKLTANLLQSLLIDLIPGNCS